MTKRKQMWIAVLSALALMIACVCGTFSAAADGEDETVTWQETEDGQFLYTPFQYHGQDGVQVVYIGDGTDVTVPATFGGQPADVVWFNNEALDLEFDSSERARALLAKARAAADRYLNITFSEGPTTVLVRPVMWPDYLRAASVTLPKSAADTTLYTVGLTALSVPTESALTELALYNILFGAQDPAPTTIDLTGATGLDRVYIGRDEYSLDCFLSGSVLKLPTEFKDAPIYRDYPSSEVDTPYCLIDYDPMPLLIQYADGTEQRSLVESGEPSAPHENDGQWQETEDGQFLYRPNPYGQEGRVEVMYIGDGTDVTVPATFGGEAFDVVWFTDASAIDFGRSDSEQAQTWYSKAEAASDRYLNLTFEEGPTGVQVTPGMYPGYVQAASVKLPKSVTGVTLYVQGLTAVSVPEDSALTTFSLYNVPEGWEHPSLTVIDLTGATGLARVWIGRDEWAGDCFAEGSVIKLPTEFKDVQILRTSPGLYYDEPYFFIDHSPMSLTIQYADGTERPLTFPGDANNDDSVDMKDVLLIRQVIAHLADLFNPTAADFNGDGSLDMKDVLLIRRVIAVGIPES